jgi:two-component system, LytTR family, sensor kinase
MPIFQNATPFQRWFRLVGTPLLGVAIYLIFYFVDPNAVSTGEYQGPWAWKQYCIDLVECVVGSILLSEASIWLDIGLNRLLPWERRPLPRLLVQTLMMTGLSIGIIELIVWLIAAIEMPGYVYTETDQLSIRQTIAIGSMMALFINAVYTGEHFLRRWQTAQLEAERLKRESAEARFEALKSQLDPHFLFNNLNTLTYLVEDNPQAVAFVENLSLVYRYILQNRHKTLVPLVDELRLADAYVFLLRQRFGDALRVETDIADCHHHKLIPPMTLQLLLENAVKHNIVDADRPLHISLRCTDAGELIVENNRQPRLNGETNRVGVGLTNIHHRYELLGANLPVIHRDASQFVVKLPLLAER